MWMVVAPLTSVELDPFAQGKCCSSFTPWFLSLLTSAQSGLFCIFCCLPSPELLPASYIPLGLSITCIQNSRFAEINAQMLSWPVIYWGITSLLDLKESLIWELIEKVYEKALIIWPQKSLNCFACGYECCLFLCSVFNSIHFSYISVVFDYAALKHSKSVPLCRYNSKPLYFTSIFDSYSHCYISVNFSGMSEYRWTGLWRTMLWDSRETKVINQKATVKE